jgi:hypothetical protein
MNKNSYKLQLLIVFLILIINISKKNNVKDLILLKGRKYMNECLKGKLTKYFIQILLIQK